MRRIQPALLALAVVLSACGQSVEASDSTTTTGPVTTSTEPGQEITEFPQTTISNVTTTTTVPDETTSSLATSSSTSAAPPPPNRPPVIEDPGFELSISPEENFFRYRIDPTATDPDGDELVYKAKLLSGGTLSEFTPPFEGTLELKSSFEEGDGVLEQGGDTLFLIVEDGEFSTEAVVEADLDGLKAVGSLRDFRLKVANPGACFFALPSRVDRTVVYSIWFKTAADGPPDVAGSLIFSDAATVHELPGFSEHRMGWDPEKPNDGGVTVLIEGEGIMEILTGLSVPYGNTESYYGRRISEFPCDFHLGGVADFNLSLNQ